VIRNVNRPLETRPLPIVATFLEALGLDDDMIFVVDVDEVLPPVVEFSVVIVDISVPLEMSPVVSGLHDHIDLAVALPVMGPSVRVVSVTVQ
jgi:hypothetical protein